MKEKDDGKMKEKEVYNNHQIKNFHPLIKIITEPSKCWYYHYFRNNK